MVTIKLDNKTVSYDNANSVLSLHLVSGQAGAIHRLSGANVFLETASDGSIIGVDIHGVDAKKGDFDVLQICAA